MSCYELAMLLPYVFRMFPIANIVSFFLIRTGHCKKWKIGMAYKTLLVIFLGYNFDNRKPE
jgi:hypothetical protein